MLYRIMVPEGGEFEAKNAFGDDADFSDYSKSAVYKLVDMGIINGMGDNSFAPKASVTRAQAAVLLRRIYSLVQKEV